MRGTVGGTRDTPKQPRQTKGYEHTKIKTLALALASLIIASISKGDPPLHISMGGPKTTFTWNGWSVTTTAVYFADSADRVSAGPDSVMVHLRLTVQNISNHGQTFIPQNAIKIVIGENKFHAEDIDHGMNYMRNIEPTLTRERQCYFEIPKSMMTTDFVLEFNQPFGDTIDVLVVPDAVPKNVDGNSIWWNRQAQNPDHTDLSGLSEDQIGFIAQKEAIGFHKNHPGIDALSIVSWVDKFAFGHNLRGKAVSDYTAEFNNAYDAMEAK